MLLVHEKQFIDFLNAEVDPSMKRSSKKVDCDKVRLRCNGRNFQVVPTMTP